MNCRVVTIGETGVGKTCCLLATYAAMRIGSRGFSWTAASMDEDQRLSVLWERLCTASDIDRWPAASSEDDMYTFNVNYHFAPWARIDWYVIRRITAEEERVAFLREAARASIVMPCISARHLEHPTTSFVRDMTNLFAAIREDAHRHGNALPRVVIVITQWDSYTECAAPIHVVDEVKTVFPALFADSGYTTTIIPVSLGSGLASDRNAEIEPTGFDALAAHILHCATETQNGVD